MQENRGILQRCGCKASLLSPAARRQRPSTIKRLCHVKQAANDVAVENGRSRIRFAVSTVVDAAVGAFERPAEGVEADGRIIVATLAAPAYTHG